jgi:two-component system sensor histidine kinase KdpD
MQEGRGRLKIFFGAAPGVGKPYQMLLSAHAKRREGVDVVVGIVESHGRRETEALLQGLEVIPRQRVEYKGHPLAEMDLDAILKRHPELVLVDELAHTNAPGSRNSKRYVDVEELIAAGIDVYTTLNVQHVDSLNDIIAQITKIRVHEIVPDSILDQANDVEVVDLSPEDLIKRFRERKVDVPPQGERTVRQFFSTPNLTALRALALRRTAQRVDEQLLAHMRAHGTPSVSRERILVCVSKGPDTAGLIRYTRRLADRLQVPWTAVHVETAKTRRLTNAELDRIADSLRLAERLGASTITIPGRDVADEVVAYATTNDITQIVIGRSNRPRWLEIVHGSVVHELVRKTGHISVHVISADDSEPVPAKSVEIRPRREPPRIGPYLGSAGAVAVALGVGLLVKHFVAVQSISLAFLTAVLASAIAWGLSPSLFAAITSVLAYSFFFLPPLYTFTVADPEHFFLLFFFLLVAVIVSNLTARTRSQIIAFRARAKTMAELFAFSRKIAGIGALDDLLWATVYQISSMLNVRTVLLLPKEDDEEIEVASGYPPEDQLDNADMTAARWTWEHKRPAGRSAYTFPNCKRLFLPLRTDIGIVGVIGIDRDAPGSLLTPDEARLLYALCDQAAVAIERISLGKGLNEGRVLAETQRVRAALLTTISHDLRTSLASILGTVLNLRSFPEKYSSAERENLLASLQGEAEHLNRVISNVVDMTRVESGASNSSGN